MPRAYYRKEKSMKKRSYLFAAALGLLCVTFATAQHPLLDDVANKVVVKYQSSTCQQLMQQKAQNKPPSPGEQKATAVAPRFGGYRRLPGGGQTHPMRHVSVKAMETEHGTTDHCKHDSLALP
jgi:hypothetical protein